MNKAAAIFLILILTLVLCSCGTLSEPVQTTSAQASDVLENKENVADEQKDYEEQEVTYYIKETRISEVTGYEPPTYSAVGTNEHILVVLLAHESKLIVGKMLVDIHKVEEVAIRECLLLIDEVEHVPVYRLKLTLTGCERLTTKESSTDALY